MTDKLEKLLRSSLDELCVRGSQALAAFTQVYSSLRLDADCKNLR